MIHKINLKTRIITGAAIASMVVPTFVFAAGPFGIGGGQAFCRALSQDESKILNRLSQAPENRFENAMNRVSERRANRDANRDSRIANRDDRREGYYQALDQRAQTEQQHAAVAEFKAAIESATATRIATVDSAVNEFRLGVNDAVNGRQDDIDDAVTTFKNAVEVAITDARTACANGEDASTIRKNLQSAITDARDEFKANRDDALQVGKNVSALAEVRKSSVQSAITAFQSVLNAAKASLREAFTR